VICACARLRRVRREMVGCSRGGPSGASRDLKTRVEGGNRRGSGLCQNHCHRRCQPGGGAARQPYLRQEASGRVILTGAEGAKPPYERHALKGLRRVFDRERYAPNVSVSTARLYGIETQFRVQTATRIDASEDARLDGEHLLRRRTSVATGGRNRQPAIPDSGCEGCLPACWPTTTSAGRSS